MPASKLKRDYSSQVTKKKKQLLFKDRSPVALPEEAAKLYADMCKASTTDDVKQVFWKCWPWFLAKSQIWRKTAKCFDDWRCVAIGPYVGDLWSMHK